MKERKHFKLLICSFIALLTCLTCLVSYTWAWIITSQNYDLGSIQFASYHIMGEVIKEEKVEDAEDAGETEFVKYTVQLTAKGDAETGYCKISIQDKEYYTEQMAPEGTLTFSLILSESDYEQLEYSPQWGIYQGKRKITEGATVNEKGKIIQAQESDEEETTEVETEAESESETPEVTTEAETEAETESESETEVETIEEVETESEGETEAETAHTEGAVEESTPETEHR